MDDHIEALIKARSMTTQKWNWSWIKSYLGVAFCWFSCCLGSKDTKGGKKLINQRKVCLLISEFDLSWNPIIQTGPRCETHTKLAWFLCSGCRGTFPFPFALISLIQAFADFISLQTARRMGLRFSEYHRGLECEQFQPWNCSHSRPLFLPPHNQITLSLSRMFMHQLTTETPCFSLTTCSNYALIFLVHGLWLEISISTALLPTKTLVRSTRACAVLLMTR